jgi:hypothetical protein
MRFIGVLIALLIAAALAYYQITGAWPGQSKKNPLAEASKKAELEGGPIIDPQQAKQRVEQIMKQQEEAQKKAMEEAAK